MIDGRFLDDGSHPGYENMAIDETLVESLSTKLSVPTFRFYTWNPFCLSLGFHQPVSEVNQDSIQKKNYELVRRPTGGRAVFHANEITYSAIIPLQNENPSYWYNKIHLAFCAAFQELNIPVENSNFQSDLKNIYKSLSGVPCFISSAKSEILLNGKKLVGSAQRVYGNFLLQHGSILLDSSHKEIVELMNFSTEREKEFTLSLLNEKSISIDEFDSNFSVSEFKNKLIPALNRELNIQFETGELLPQENEMVYHFSKKYRRVS